MSAPTSAAAVPESAPLRLPFYYGWVNVGVAALAMTATLPGRTHGLGLITEPLLADLRIDGVTFGAINFVAIVLGAAFCLPGGQLLDRFGTRAVLTIVSLALGVAVLLMSGVSSWIELLLTLILVRGLGQGTLSVLSMALPGKWFTRRLGLAMGVFTFLLAFGFIGSFSAVQLVARRDGWRMAWAGVGLALILGMAPVAWLLARSSPEACGLEIEPGVSEKSKRGLGIDFTLGAALRTPAFWAFGLATSLFGLTWSAITLFNQAILQAHGFDQDTFLLVMILLTVSGLLTNLLAGWLATRWPLGRLLGLGMAMFAASLASFPFVAKIAQVVVYALTLGVAGGVITVVHFSFYAEAFGRRHLGKVQGAAQVLSVLASAVGPLLLAACKDATGSYDGMFYGSAAGAVLLGAAAWLVPFPRATT